MGLPPLVAIAEMALPESMTEPPPMATTPSQFSDNVSATPSSTDSQDGSLRTEMEAYGIEASSSRSVSAASAPGRPSLTTRTLVTEYDASSAGTCGSEGW